LQSWDSPETASKTPEISFMRFQALKLIEVPYRSDEWNKLENFYPLKTQQFPVAR